VNEGYGDGTRRDLPDGMTDPDGTMIKGIQAAWKMWFTGRAL